MAQLPLCILHHCKDKIRFLGLSMGKGISPSHKAVSSLMETPGTGACYQPWPEFPHPEGAEEPHHLRTLLKPNSLLSECASSHAWASHEGL